MNPLVTLSADERRDMARLVQLVARLWLREVDEPLDEALRTSGWLDQLRRTLPIPKDGRTGRSGPSSLRDLAVDYCRLFVGPTGHLPPIESVWVAGQLEADATASMKTWCELAGYERPESARNVFLDHLGVQLDLLHHVLSQDAWWESHPDDMAAFTLDYATAHLAWPTELLDAVEARAETDLYRLLPHLTRQLIGELIGPRIARQTGSADETP